MNVHRNLVLAWRQTLRRGRLSLLQMIGITIGVAASLLLCSYINWHYSFDRFHPELGQLFRVSTVLKEGDAIEVNALTPAGLAPAVIEHIPDVNLSSRIARWIANDVVLSQQKQVIRDDRLIFAEPSFFQLFAFTILEGLPLALDDPNVILLTQSKARALFGEEDPLGKEVLFENFKPLQVMGIVDDPPPNSHLQFSSIISFQTLQDWGFDVFSDGQLDIPYVYTYLKVNKGADITSLADKMSSATTGRGVEPSSTSLKGVSFQLMPVSELHLFADNVNDIIPSGQGKGIWILFGISLLILLISWVNHINIFTASAIQQGKSLSVRKIIGAHPGQLFQILFAQSLLTASLGTIFGIIIAIFIKPILFESLNIPVHRSMLSWLHWQPSIILLISILCGTIAFSFLPSFWIVTRYTNELVTYQNFTPKGIRLRLTLVGIQFAIIITLMIGGMVIYRQAQFINQKDPGIGLDRILSIRSPLGFDATQFDQQYLAFKQYLLTKPSITKVGFSRKIPGEELEYTGPVIVDNQNFDFGFLRNFIEPDFLLVYDLPILAQLDRSFVKDGRYAFVNKKVVELLGIKNPADILNKRIRLYGWEIEIIGVVENFHQQSFHHPIAPMMMDFSGNLEASVDGYISIQYNRHASSTDINVWTQKAFELYFPLTVYESIPVKEFYYNQYSWDQNFQKISAVFTVLGLSIGCLGLLALALLLIQQRLKEVSIRKVLGASTSSILLLFSRDFLLVILLAMPMAFLSAYFLLNRWLQNYAFHVEISWWIYCVAGLIALMMGFLTISSQSISVAKINPVEQLRNT